MPAILDGLIRALQPVALAFGLGACTIATPLRTTGPAPETVVVAITQASLKPDKRMAFDRSLDTVAAILSGTPGLLGWSLRRELFGTEAWTLTIWESDAARAAFVGSQVHRDAIQASIPALTGTRFARLTLPSRELPFGWPQALAVLERDGVSYD